MIWMALGIGAGAVAAILLALWIAGAGMSRDHEATTSRVVDAAPEEVWRLVTDPDEVPRWRREVKRIDVRKRADDHPVTFVEILARDSVPYRVEEWEPGVRLVTRIDSDRRAFGGTWTWELEPEAEGTKVTITERGFIRPALFRLLARYVFGYEATMNRVLEDLAAAPGKAGEEA